MTNQPTDPIAALVDRLAHVAYDVSLKDFKSALRQTLEDQRNEAYTAGYQKAVGVKSRVSPGNSALVVDPDECPAYGISCKCGACEECGFQKHTAVHMGTMQDPTRPYGHTFKPKMRPGAPGVRQ